jgi:hypothetical protein
MATVTLTLEEYEALRSMATSFETTSIPAVPVLKSKKRKKVSKYSREFGIQLKKLVKKHPRTKVTKLMSQAHRNTKRALK